MDVGDDIGPLPAEAEEAVEKPVEVRQILRQYVVVHPAWQQRAARHEEELLDGVGQIAVQLVGKGCAGDIVEAVLLARVSEGRHALPGGEHPRRKQRRVAAAGDVDGAVRVLLADGAELPQDTIRLEQARLHKDKLRLPAAAPEKCRQRLLPAAIPDDLAGAEIDDAPGAEHIRRQYILNGTLVVQLDQRIHAPLRLPSCSNSI